jgi:6-pyruvoyltetrahydropterin/6-carboxytetrahydropterin synthase
MFAIEVQSTFDATHALRLGAKVEEPHGHQFHVIVQLTCAPLDAAQTVADFHLIEMLLETILQPWRRQDLNQLPVFHGVYPSAERIAQQIGLRLQEALGTLPDDPVTMRALRVSEVRLTEAPGCVALWRP